LAESAYLRLPFLRGFGGKSGSGVFEGQIENLDLGFGVSDLGFGVSDLGFRILDFNVLGFRDERKTERDKTTKNADFPLGV